MALWRQPLDRDRILITHGIVHIIDDRCKGCGFCIEFCPRGVLLLSLSHQCQRLSSTGDHPGDDLCKLWIMRPAVS